MRSIEVKEFINKYGWCKKNQTYVAFIKTNESPAKEEEYDKLLQMVQKKSKQTPYLNLKHIENDLYGH
jgi:hypothetical protein